MAVRRPLSSHLYRHLPSLLLLRYGIDESRPRVLPLTPYSFSFLFSFFPFCPPLASLPNDDTAYIPLGEHIFTIMRLYSEFLRTTASLFIVFAREQSAVLHSNVLSAMIEPVPTAVTSHPSGRWKQAKDFHWNYDQKSAELLMCTCDDRSFQHVRSFHECRKTRTNCKSKRHPE